MFTDRSNQKKRALTRGSKKLINTANPFMEGFAIDVTYKVIYN